MNKLIDILNIFQHSTLSIFIVIILFYLHVNIFPFGMFNEVESENIFVYIFLIIIKIFIAYIIVEIVKYTTKKIPFITNYLFKMNNKNYNNEIFNISITYIVLGLFHNLSHDLNKLYDIIVDNRKTSI